MKPPIIETTQLCRHFPVNGGIFGRNAVLRAVDGVDLVLREGETLGLVGESGCGKSTLGRLLLKLLEPSAGEIRFRGARLANLRKEELKAFRREAQMIFQDPFSSLNPRMRIGETIAEPLLVHRSVPRQECREKVIELMGRVGLSPDHYQRYPHEFSGGQRQRIGIARSLAAEPRLIVADEPVSALDLSIQAQILNLLQDIREEFGLTFLFISHDLAVVRFMSDRVAVMYLGKIVETGESEALFRNPLHPYTEALISAIPAVSGGGGQKRIVLQGDLPSPVAPPSGCPFHPRCPYAKPLCSDAVPLLEEKVPGRTAACHFSRELYPQAFSGQVP